MQQLVTKPKKMNNISHHTYKSFGLVRPNAVEDHIKCTRQKATLTRRARHSECLSTSCYSISKKQTCNNHTNHVNGTTTTKLLTANTQMWNKVFFFFYHSSLGSSQRRGVWQHVQTAPVEIWKRQILFWRYTASRVSQLEIIRNQIVIMVTIVIIVRLPLYTLHCGLFWSLQVRVAGLWSCWSPRCSTPSRLRSEVAHGSKPVYKILLEQIYHTKYYNE